MEVLLEIFFLKIVKDKVLYKKYVCPMWNSEDPDLLVVKLWVGIFGGSPDTLKQKCIRDSPSWRYNNDGGIILTYLFYSEELDLDGDDSKFLLFNDLKFPQELGPEISDEERKKEENILAHGLRHLGLLIKLNNSLYKTKMKPENFRKLRRKNVIGLAGKFSK